MLKAREKSRVHGAIGFGFDSHWLKNWRESFKPITKRSNRNHVITFDTHLKTALTVITAITEITFFPIVHLILPSAILNKVHGKYLEQLKTFLLPVLQNAPAIKFVRCWRAQIDGWGVSTFHSNCDGRGPTVTIIQVGSYIFGGYTDKSWYGEYIISLSELLCPSPD